MKGCRPGQQLPTSAVALIVGSVLCFTLFDGIVKHLASMYPVPLLVWARWSVQMLATLLWLGPRMGRALGVDRARPEASGMTAAPPPETSRVYIMSRHGQ